MNLIMFVLATLIALRWILSQNKPSFAIIPKPPCIDLPNCDFVKGDLANMTEMRMSFGAV